MSNKDILGFIGTGVMGASMAGHLLAAGNEVHIYNRTKTKAKKLMEMGAVWEDSPSALASKCNIIFTIVGYPKDVEEVYLGKNGLLESAAKGTLLIDMTTSSPKLACKIWEAGNLHDIAVLDAPVTGGDKGARDAVLTILVGGSKKDFDRALHYFKLMGTKIRHMGTAGYGQKTKLVNQIALAGTMTGMCEGLAFARECGLDPKEVLEAISGGAAGSWSLTNYAPRILDRDFEPGFFVKHYIKDMILAEEAADEIGLDLPALSLTRALYEDVVEIGLENAGTQSLFCLYDQVDK